MALFSTRRFNAKCMLKPESTFVGVDHGTCLRCLWSILPWPSKCWGYALHNYKLYLPTIPLALLSPIFGVVRQRGTFPLALPRGCKLFEYLLCCFILRERKLVTLQPTLKLLEYDLFDRFRRYFWGEMLLTYLVEFSEICCSAGPACKTYPPY